MTLGLIDRFDALLQAGRTIATALTREAVYTAVRDAGLVLLRGEECVVLDIEGGDIDGSHQGQPCSRTLVRRAIETRQPVVASVGMSDEPSESLVLAGARSVLCAPIAVRGDIVACVYVSHRGVGGLFGPDEERLAQFIATLGGAALENAAGLSNAETHLIASSVAGLAHAIKNPVAVIRAYLGMLRSTSDRANPGVVDHYLHTMEGALERIGELVGRLQSVQVGASQKTAVCLERLIDEAMAEVRPLFSEELGYRVDRHVSPDAPAVIIADGEQLRLVVVNLLVNAHQAMPRGGRVRISIRSDHGRRMAIVIADEGSGIPATIEPRLFEPFVTSKPDGTGLGLWVCQKIVEERHQGRIAVTAVPGGGTAVCITLPVGQEADTVPG